MLKTEQGPGNAPNQNICGGCEQLLFLRRCTGLTVKAFKWPLIVSMEVIASVPVQVMNTKGW